MIGANVYRVISVMKTSLLAALLLPVLAFAQEFRGTILGRVIDQTGAAVPIATVQVTNVETRTVLRSVSNESGNYQVPFLLPGIYTVAVESAGFKRIERTGVRVLTGSAVTVDLTLEVGSATESVTVTAAPPLLEVANGDLSQVMTREYV